MRSKFRASFAVANGVIASVEVVTSIHRPYDAAAKVVGNHHGVVVTDSHPASFEADHRK